MRGIRGDVVVLVLLSCSSTLSIVNKQSIVETDKLPCSPWNEYTTPADSLRLPLVLRFPRSPANQMPNDVLRIVFRLPTRDSKDVVSFSFLPENKKTVPFDNLPAYFHMRISTKETKVILNTNIDGSPERWGKPSVTYYPPQWKAGDIIKIDVFLTHHFYSVWEGHRLLGKLAHREETMHHDVHFVQFGRQGQHFELFSVNYYCNPLFVPPTPGGKAAVDETPTAPTLTTSKKTVVPPVGKKDKKKTARITNNVLDDF